MARELLLRLVTSEGTRRVLSRNHALGGLGPEAGEVLDRLTKSRLVTVRKAGHDEGAEASLELVHESLLVAWKRLARWLEGSHEEREFLDEIGRAADLWQRRGHRSAELWRGEALRDAEERYRRNMEGIFRSVKDGIVTVDDGLDAVTDSVTVIVNTPPAIDTAPACDPDP